MATTKVCTKCNEEKEFGEFNKNKDGKFGVTSVCKSCKRAYREENKEAISVQKRTHYEKNKDVVLEKNREYYNKNKETISVQHHEYYNENKEKLIQNGVNYRRIRLAEDPLFRLIHNMRTRVNHAIKANSGEKAEKTMELLGCSVQHVRDHLESQFTEGMTWETQGEWHIDHIRPCASFNLEDPEEQKKCFHWTNLQPLWAADNIRKGDKWEEPTHSMH